MILAETVSGPRGIRRYGAKSRRVAAAARGVQIGAICVLVSSVGGAA